MVRYCLQLVVTCDYFYRLQSHHRPVNYLSTAVQLTNRLLLFWADGGFVYYKRVSSASFLVSSQSLILIIASWFIIALDDIRTRRILREKADCKQSTEPFDICSKPSFNDTQFKERFRCTQLLRSKYAIIIFIYIATTLPPQLLPVRLTNISNALS